MATSWRIETNLIDKTRITPTSSPIVGATVLTSTFKGCKKFKKFYKGDTQGVIDTFGYPDANNQSIQNAIDIVSKCDMWLASPYKNGKYGGVFVTPNGTTSFVSGMTTNDVVDFSEVECKEFYANGNGAITSFTKTLKNSNKIDISSIKLFKNDTDVEITLTESSEGIYNITDVGSTISEGTFNVNDGDFDITFDVAPSSTDVYTIEYNLNMSDAYFVLFDCDMQKDDMGVKVVKSTDVDDAFDVAVYRYSPINDEYEELINSPFTVGLKPTSKNNSGTNIYIKNVFTEERNIFKACVVNDEVSTFVDDVNMVKVSGGDRGDECSDSDIVTIYDDLKDSTKYQIKFVFDSFASSTIATKFESLRNDYQKYTRFLTCTADVTPTTIIEDTTHAYDYNITNNRGIYEYTLTWGIHKDLYQGNDFNCSNMGLIAGRLVDVLVAGGGNPAWIDENGVGGILGASITKLNQQCTESESRLLDNLGFNVVIMDATYGAMIVGWKTRQIKKTVYSYIAQSSLADTIIDLIEKEVLPQRIAKFIDDVSYIEVTNGCNTILNSYSKFLEDYYVLCSDKNNDDESRANQTLRVTVGVIFKGCAEKVILSFVAMKQGINLKEEIESL